MGLIVVFVLTSDVINDRTCNSRTSTPLTPPIGGEDATRIAPFRDSANVVTFVSKKECSRWFSAAKCVNSSMHSDVIAIGERAIQSL